MYSKIKKKKIEIDHIYDSDHPVLNDVPHPHHKKHCKKHHKAKPHSVKQAIVENVNHDLHTGDNTSQTIHSIVHPLEALNKQNKAIHEPDHAHMNPEGIF